METKEPSTKDWNLDFISDYSSDEVCPMCGCEVVVRNNGTASCSECKHPNILPCSECQYHNNYKCDWSRERICTPFRHLEQEDDT